MTIKTFDQAQQFLFDHIPHGKTQEFPGGKGQERMKRLMELLDNPQEKISVVHIAGTSGKGSTATITSALLTATGKKVGLHVSPHILDIRERIQINNQIIAKEAFIEYLNQIMPAIDSLSKSSFGQPTYFEILVALAFYTFAKEQVDFAVMETGLGGLYDGTNVVQNSNKLCVITKIGYDHMQILGNTLAEIATQKAGIIHPHNTVLSTWQDPEAEKVIKTTAQQKQAEYFELAPHNITNVTVSEKGTFFDFSFLDRIYTNLHLSLIGAFQAENAAEALAALILLEKKRLVSVTEPALRDALEHLNLPARMDVQHINGHTLIIDGAHNPQKMTRFLESLQLILQGKKATFLVAFKKGKDYEEMLPMIIPFAQKIIATEFFTESFDMIHFSEESTAIKQVCEQNGFTNVTAIKQNDKALQGALEQDKIIVATGSLYFSSELYALLRDHYSSQHGSL
jgi:dihydrofolate synthase/folylpolyglutamate synthase